MPELTAEPEPEPEPEPEREPEPGAEAQPEPVAGLPPSADAPGRSSAHRPPAPAPEREPEREPAPELDLDLPPAETTSDANAAADGAVALAAAALRDLRPYWLRNLDAVRFGMSGLLADPRLGRHRGMPVTAVITMSLADLEAATGADLRARAGAGKAVSGGGALISMRDAVRMLAQSRPYLAVFDEVDGRPLYLGRGRRLASTDQRLVLHARDRGCTYPSCPRPASYSQAHHLDEWSAKNGRTDAHRLGFGCDGHHALVGPGPDAWATTVCPPGSRFAGRVLWHPPVSVDRERRGLLNHFHHPEEYLQDIPLFPGPDDEPPQRE